MGSTILPIVLLPLIASACILTMGRTNKEALSLTSMAASMTLILFVFNVVIPFMPYQEKTQVIEVQGLNTSTFPKISTTITIAELMSEDDWSRQTALGLFFGSAINYASAALTKNSVNVHTATSTCVVGIIFG